MVDLNRAYQEVKSLPDEALDKELQQPTGFIPGYLIMAEMEDRKALRAGGGQDVPKMSMKDELISGLPPMRQYKGGGMVSGLNPVYSALMQQQNPMLAAGAMQEQINQAAGGLPTLQAPQTVGAPPPPGGLVAPGPSGSPMTAPNYNGGIANLLKG